MRLSMLLFLSLTVVCLHADLTAAAESPSQDDTQPQARVFPGAVGFGVETPAGTDGRVIRVTNLESRGPGSLRAAIETEGPRLVVFDVGGVIDLGEDPLRINRPFLTIAGQTAPSPGITIIKGSVYAYTNDILIQHIRIRPGDAGRKAPDWGFTPHGFRAFDASYNVVIDHCSISWAIEETCSVSGYRVKDGAVISPESLQREGRFAGWPDRAEDMGPKNVTFSNNIFSEGLLRSLMSKGVHSHGSLIKDGCRNVALIGNLYAHNDLRNPYFKRHTTGAIVNNLIYNANSAAMNIGCDGRWGDAPFEGEPATLSIAGNVLIYGPSTLDEISWDYFDHFDGSDQGTMKKLRRPLPMITSWMSIPGLTAARLYIDDNLVLDHDGKSVPRVIHEDDRENFVILSERPVWPERLKPLASEQLESHITKHAGARPWDRDEVDKRIIRSVRERTGRIIDSQDEVGGYPNHRMTKRVLDVPRENRREWLAELAVGGDDF